MIETFTRLLVNATACSCWFPRRNNETTLTLPGSRQKLSGAIPIVIAYQLPVVIHVVIHEELYDLYQDRLSSITHATHSDSAPSFNAAMNQLLEALDDNKKMSSNMTVAATSEVYRR